MNDEEFIRKEVLDYLDLMLLGLENFEANCIFNHIVELNEQVDSYKEKIKKEYSLELKRK